MTTLTYPSRAQHNTSALTSLRHTVIAFVQDIQDGVDMANRYHTLSHMSDAQLAKRGLTRANLLRVVVLGDDSF